MELEELVSEDQGILLIFSLTSFGLLCTASGVRPRVGHRRQFKLQQKKVCDTKTEIAQRIYNEDENDKTFWRHVFLLFYHCLKVKVFLRALVDG